MTKAERVQRARHMQKSAADVLAKLDLLARWGRVGNPILVGSVALDVVVRPDIDIEVYVDELSPTAGFGVMAPLADCRRCGESATGMPAITSWPACTGRSSTQSLTATCGRSTTGSSHTDLVTTGPRRLRKSVSRSTPMTLLATLCCPSRRKPSVVTNAFRLGGSTRQRWTLVSEPTTPSVCGWVNAMSGSGVNGRRGDVARLASPDPLVSALPPAPTTQVWRSSRSRPGSWKRSAARCSSSGSPVHRVQASGRCRTTSRASPVHRTRLPWTWSDDAPGSPRSAHPSRSNESCRDGPKPGCRSSPHTTSATARLQRSRRGHD